MTESIQKQVKAIKQLNEISLKNEIVILGSTYMSNFPLYELVNKSQFEHAVYNRSFKGLTISQALEIYKECILPLKPKKVFLSLGEEDQNSATAIKDYNSLVREIHKNLPDVQFYLICLNENSEFAQKFNENIIGQCNNKNVRYIRFIDPLSSNANVYKSRFKQLSCFFRDKPITMTEAFVISGI